MSIDQITEILKASKSLGAKSVVVAFNEGDNITVKIVWEDENKEVVSSPVTFSEGDKLTIKITPTDEKKEVFLPVLPQPPQINPNDSVIYPQISAYAVPIITQEKTTPYTIRNINTTTGAVIDYSKD